MGVNKGDAKERGQSKHVTFNLTSHLTSKRPSLRAEKTSWFGGLKSPPRRYIKSVCYYSLDISLHGIVFQSEKHYSLAMLSIVLLRASKAAIAITHCSIMTIDLSLEFGAVA